MLVPVYADFGKGWVRLGSAQINGNSMTNLSNLKLPQAPKKMAVAAMHDVLATGIENGKK